MEDVQLTVITVINNTQWLNVISGGWQSKLKYCFWCENMEMDLKHMQECAHCNLESLGINIIEMLTDENISTR